MTLNDYPLLHVPPFDRFDSHKIGAQSEFPNFLRKHKSHHNASRGAHDTNSRRTLQKGFLMTRGLLAVAEAVAATMAVITAMTVTMVMVVALAKTVAMVTAETVAMTMATAGAACSVPGNFQTKA